MIRPELFSKKLTDEFLEYIENRKNMKNYDDQIIPIDEVKMKKSKEPYQKRVIEEKIQLDKKINALDNFINSNPLYNKINQIEKNLLIRQLEIMTNYSDVLDERISTF